MDRVEPPIGRRQATAFLGYVNEVGPPSALPGRRLAVQDGVLPLLAEMVGSRARAIPIQLPPDGEGLIEGDLALAFDHLEVEVERLAAARARVTYRVTFAVGAAAQVHHLPEHARDALVARAADLGEAPRNGSTVLPPDDDPTFREAIFGQAEAS
jgi:hypothetical protein